MMVSGSAKNEIIGFTKVLTIASKITVANAVKKLLRCTPFNREPIRKIPTVLIKRDKIIVRTVISFYFFTVRIRQKIVTLQII